MATLAQSPFNQSSGPSKLRDIPCVDSSFLANFKYDPSTFQLVVEMKNGSERVHFFVYPNVIEDLIKAPSKGKFYNEMIKGRTQSMAVTHKQIGPAIRNPLKGPVKHEPRKQPVHYKP